MAARFSLRRLALPTRLPLTLTRFSSTDLFSELISHSRSPLDPATKGGSARPEEQHDDWWQAESQAPQGRNKAVTRKLHPIQKRAREYEAAKAKQKKIRRVSREGHPFKKVKPAVVPDQTPSTQEWHPLNLATLEVELEEGGRNRHPGVTPARLRNTDPDPNSPSLERLSAAEQARIQRLKLQHGAHWQVIYEEYQWRRERNRALTEEWKLSKTPSVSGKGLDPVPAPVRSSPRRIQKLKHARTKVAWAEGRWIPHLKAKHGREEWKEVYDKLTRKLEENVEAALRRDESMKQEARLRKLRKQELTQQKRMLKLQKKHKEQSGTLEEKSHVALFARLDEERRDASVRAESSK